MPLLQHSALRSVLYMQALHLNSNASYYLSVLGKCKAASEVLRLHNCAV
jgi:hypothetical protein